MELGLAGKRVIITGSTRGIGLAAAKLFLEEGARVIINGVDRNRLASALELLKASDEQAEVSGVAADVSTREGAEALFKQAGQQYGGVDILINNAGINKRYPSWSSIKDQEWDETYRVNLKSVHLCSVLAIESMQKQGEGVIVNASSFGSLIPSAGFGLYASTKAAVNCLTKSMAAELAPWNIRVNAYMPGVIETDMNADVIRNNESNLLAQISMRRMGKPQEVAAPIVFLASSQASYITGAVLEISGGKLSIQHPNAAWPDCY